MAFKNLLQSNLQKFAQEAYKHGWTKEETLSVLKAVREELNTIVRRGHTCNVGDLLRKYSRPIVERKKKKEE